MPLPIDHLRSGDVDAVIAPVDEPVARLGLTAMGTGPAGGNDGQVDAFASEVIPRLR